ncbi:putative alpha-N-acetylglucosaminidase [Rhexocercosporidium sp. MPI-PUGE-AT-0058]|nr:putative alpha-N-acetylglucosaminidase [Rhexocercosporidium sp. MPI-PUGE-AT-0058]
MLLSRCLVWLAAALGVLSAISTQGIKDLVKRRLPAHIDDFEFRLLGNETSKGGNDVYSVSSMKNGRIIVEGNSLSALSSGLHRYLTDAVHVDIWWFIGSRLDTGPETLPILDVPMNGSSVVPWRYHFNTVTFSYTSAFWKWEDWEVELDWLALRGVNLPLAWVGQEKILIEVYRELGMTDTEILSFLSGPAYQSWNRFGNIQGSWNGELPMEWIDNQSALQKNITRRMVELGMMPVLPCFTGFVPPAIRRVLPNATVVNGSNWEKFPVEYTNVTFLQPLDPAFSMIQKSFIAKQVATYGNITHIYTLDQYNENHPESEDLDYLRSVSHNTWQSLKAADPNAIWMMQGWLFYDQSDFWIEERIEAYLGGVENDQDMLIIDLFSESAPQWQRTNSYFGKPWLWCQLHGFGGNMGLYGQIENVTINPIEALAGSSSLVGFGLTMEGQEGNEIMYDLLLDQAWSASPINTESYFHNWVTRRYAGTGVIPQGVYNAWDLMRTTVYNNTNSGFVSVPKSIFELSPNISNMFHLGHHPTIINYSPANLISAWNLLFNASKSNQALWDNPAYQYDMTDITRQVFSNSFTDTYKSLIAAYSSPSPPNSTISSIGTNLTSQLRTLDSVLITNPAFSLSNYLSAARSSSANTTLQSFYALDLRNQITLWGPNGEINDYASKSWGGLVNSYYLPRWEIFVKYLTGVPLQRYNETELNGQLRRFERGWLSGGRNATAIQRAQVVVGLRYVLEDAVGKWSRVFGE